MQRSRRPPWTAQPFMAASSSASTAEQQRFLYSSSQRAHMDGATALSRVLLFALDSSARRTETQLPARALHRICSSCFQLLVPGVSCKVWKRKHGHRPLARRYSLHTRCGYCGVTHCHAMPTPPSSRSALASAEEQKQHAGAISAPAAGSGSSKSQAKRAARKPADLPKQKRSVRPLRGPEPPAPDASSGDSSSLFGFDFVAL